MEETRPNPSQPAPGQPDPRFLARLPAEVHHWEEAGVITPEQGRTILGGYEFRDAAQQSRSRLVTVLVILGAVLLGLGVILFVAANWQSIPSTVKLVIMIVGVPAIYGIGFWLRYHRGYPVVGASVILVGVISYGAAVHLVAQVYQIPVHSPNLMLFWFVGTLPLAYVVQTQPLMALALVLGLAAVGFRGQEWLLDPGHYLLLALPLYLALGLALMALAKLQTSFQPTRFASGVYETVGLLTVFAVLYLSGFWELRKEFGFGWYTATGYFIPITAEFWAVAGLAVTVAAGAWIYAYLDAGRQSRSRAILLYEGMAALGLLALACVVVFVSGTGHSLYVILFNIVYLAGVVGLVFLGYYRARELYINLGIVLFCIIVFSRYFEFGFGLLDRSVIFIVAGSILIVGGFLVERGRRRVVDRMRGQEGNGGGEVSGGVSDDR